MLHPHARVARIGGALGRGVIATRELPKGTIVWVEDPSDRTLTSELLQGLTIEQKKDWELLAWADTSGKIRLCGDAAQYLNHSCQPNTVAIGESCTIAVRDVSVGEELTEDYLLLNRRYLFDCACGTSWCRVRPTVDDKDEAERILERLDALALEAVQRLESVEQKLLPHVPSEEVGHLLRACRRQERPVPLRRKLLPRPVVLEPILFDGAEVP